MNLDKLLLTVGCKYQSKSQIRCYNQNRRIMSQKKKSELFLTFDELRHQDAKKRLAAVAEIKQIAAAIGPARTRSELINFLAEFVDDEEPIVMKLLEQFESFSTVLGGQEHEKALIPLLIAFCKTDERKPAFKACQILKRILSSNKDVAVQYIKKLMKNEMSIAKQCGVQLIKAIIPINQPLQSALLELYTSLIKEQNPQYKIICAKYLHEIYPIIKNKQELGKVLDIIYSDGQDLCKIYALKGLIMYYEINPNSVLTKFKNLSVINCWRINMKICEYIELISSKCTKPHFKLIFEPSLLKYMVSQQPQLRAFSCKTLYYLAKNMSEEEQKHTFLNNLKKLSVDTVNYVKVQFAKNIVFLSSALSSQMLNEHILPMIFDFIKNPNIQTSVAVIKSYDSLVKIISKESMEENIIKPLLKQLLTNNWRVKCQIIVILKAFIAKQPMFLGQQTLTAFISLLNDKIDAVRLQVNQLLVQIMTKNSKEWTDQNMVPLLVPCMKQNGNYIKKQNLLYIIDKTAGQVSEKTLKDVYQNTVISFLVDKVPNVRVKSIEIIKKNSKLCSGAVDKQLQLLKDDPDTEVRQVAKKLRA